jgi:hypothetical protein
MRLLIIRAVGVDPASGIFNLDKPLKLHAPDFFHPRGPFEFLEWVQLRYVQQHVITGRCSADQLKRALQEENNWFGAADFVQYADRSSSAMTTFSSHSYACVTA